MEKHSIPYRRETNEVSPIIAPYYRWESFQAIKQTREPKEIPELPWDETTEMSSLGGLNN